MRVTIRQPSREGERDAVHAVGSKRKDGSLSPVMEALSQKEAGRLGLRSWAPSPGKPVLKSQWCCVALDEAATSLGLHVFLL
jgi:hypothetical protein